MLIDVLLLSLLAWGKFLDVLNTIIKSSFLAVLEYFMY